uniref:Programmed cell death protein 2 C-terminal domain-containing protein n=1 Tax=Leptobrachium leishanense TaxID=445787 RepID=A0A8C5PXK7_9ANUR
MHGCVFGSRDFMMADSTTGQRVLLGFKDVPLEQPLSSWEVSKIGGVPDVPSQVKLAIPACPLCAAALCHVTQLYCPLEGSAFHRVIHMFACCRKECWGKKESWVALRSQCMEEPKPPPAEGSLIQQQESLAATDWCDNADNWGLDEDAVESLPAATAVAQAQSGPVTARDTDCASQLQNLSLADRSDNPLCGGFAFYPYYISVADEEECGSDSDLEHARRLLRDYEKREGLPQEEPESCTGKGEREKYEKQNLRSHDTVFYKFLKKIAPCRQQIIRYSWNGSPLYMSPTERGFQPPPCTRCGGRRVFEFQLMPALVSMLRGTTAVASLEFGTVLVFSCERSCWTWCDGSPAQEYCSVQEDPDQQYFH